MNGFIAVEKLENKRENIKHVLKDWKGPEGCLATDRIMVDGSRIGYMYREEPDPDMPDSGWRFTAGDDRPTT